MPSGCPATVPTRHPGIDGVMFVGAEHGDVIIHAELAGRPFCALVLTLDHALALSLGLCARVVDERRRPS